MPILARSAALADSTPHIPHTDPTAAHTATTTGSTVAHNPAIEYVSWALHSTLGACVTAAGVLAIASLFNPGLRKALAPLGRLATGGLVFVTPGAWDSSFTRPAPERPENQPMYRGERFPRTRWAKAPGYVRMLARWGAAGYGWALSTAPWLVLAGTAVVGAGIVVRRVMRELRDVVFNNSLGVFVAGARTALGEDRAAPEWIAAPKARVTWYPIVVAPVVLRLARKVSDRLEHFLGKLAIPAWRIPLEDDDARILVRLDATMIERATIAEVGHLGLARIPEGPWVAKHHEAKLHLEFKHKQRPPKFVEYNDEAFQRFAIDDVPIGMKAGDKGPEWVTMPLKKVAPHAVESATTGWGKTVTANVYVAHTAGNGGRVYINDPKRIGFVQAFGHLDNVIIRTTTEGWEATVLEFHDEMQRRYELIEQYPEIKENPELFFQPWFLVTDERGSYVSDLVRAAKARGEKGMPVVFGYEKKILWQARAAGMYMFDLAQQANLPVFLDSDGRDQRMCRIAAGPQTRSSWVMLFPGAAKKTVALRKGRAMFGIGVDEPTEIQLAFITDEQARAYAKAGMGIAEKENEARKRRLADLIAAHGAAVPPDVSLGSPGKIAGSVPVQDRYTGTQPQDAIPAEFAGGSEFAGESGNAPVFGIINGGEDADPSVYVNVPAPQKRPLDADGSSTDGGEEIIVGTAAAAEFLGMQENSFIVARKRRPISGEKRRGTSPYWTPLVLSEWRSQSPRAGAN